MYVVTYHDFDGSTAEAAQPRAAWAFPTPAEAEAFTANFLARCRALNPMFARDSEFALITTPITNALATMQSASHDELFDSWNEEVQPEFLDLDTDELKGATAAGKILDVRNAREEAVRDGWPAKCTGCQGQTIYHSHKPAWACTDDELLEQERELGIVS